MSASALRTAATLEAIVAATSARNYDFPDTWEGTCPTCHQTRKLWVQIFSDTQAEVRCMSGRCNSAAIRDALDLDASVHTETYTYKQMGEEVAVDVIHVDHSQHVAGENMGLNPVAAMMMDSTALASLPKPEPLIENTLDRHTFALLVGYFGTGKSFIALDWAASIATGTPWMNRPTEKGKVLYVLGEGVHGIHDRLAAWQEHHGVTIAPGQLIVTRAPVQLADAKQRGYLVEAVQDGGFDLVIFDTLARVAVGLEENSAKDMGILVAAVDEVRCAMEQGTVLMVHHTGKDKGDVRGSSSLGGAADTYYLVKGDGRGTLTLDRKKRKDGPQADFMPLALQEVGESVVVVPGVYTGQDDTRQKIADGIREFLRAHGASTQTAIRSAVSGSNGLKPQVLARMVELSLLTYDNPTRKYDLAPDAKRYMDTTLPPLPPIVWADQPDMDLDF